MEMIVSDFDATFYLGVDVCINYDEA